MTATSKLSPTMRETLKRLPDEWVSFTPRFVACFSSVEALERRGLAEVHLAKKKTKGRTTFGPMMVRRTPAGKELIA